ncbi:MAG TPA: PH domain-containing protein [Acidimicrobiales bacterium]
MAFPRNLLNDKEELVLDLRPHWIYLALPTLALGAAVILGIVVAAGVSGSSTGVSALRIAVGVIVLVALVWFIRKYLKWNSTMFVLTGDRIITRHGVLSKQGVEIPLDRITTVFFHQSLFERMVGAGDLSIESAGEHSSETFSDVRKPSIVQKEIYVQMEANENRKYDRMRGGPAAPAGGGAPAPAAAPAAPGPADPTARLGDPTGGHLSIPEQIEKLDELRQRGAITDDEFTKKKSELLDRM